VFLAVWRNLVLLVVQLAHGWPKLPFLLFYLLSLTLLLILLHIIIEHRPPSLLLQLEQPGRLFTLCQLAISDIDIISGSYYNNGHVGR